MRASQFAELPPASGHVVLLGDSITEYGLWQEWFSGLPVLNRGISGETSADLLRRLDSAIHEPAAVFLLIGTNDLSAGISLADIVRNVRALLEEIERRAPGTPVVVQSVMPRTARFRDDIRLLNDAYRALVDAAPAHVQYLDLWPALADEQGLLRSAFTEDGLHLGGAGYAAWVDVLRPHVQKVLNGS
jgi:lysophospholipase L1-like esterase